MDALAQTLKTFADPTRLRILRLLSREALNVGEMTTILGMAQPSVSKQLGELKRSGLIREERNGGYAFYQLDERRDAVWKAVAAELAHQEDGAGDLARLAEVIRRRTERGGGPSRLLEPGRSWPAWARALGWLIPPVRVADLGCGDGALTAEIARWAREVVAIDHDETLLQMARRRLERQGVTNVRFLRESIEELSLPDGSLDVAILSQALHYAGDPGQPLSEAWRILVAGGRLLLLDLASHGEEWVRSKLGHVHLGFARGEIERRMVEAGFDQVRVDDMPKGGGQPFRVVVATGTKPAPARPPRRSPDASRARGSTPGAGDDPKRSRRRRGKATPPGNPRQGPAA